MKSHVGILIVGLITVTACAARAQEVSPVPASPVPQSASPEQSPPVPPPVVPPQTPVGTPPTPVVTPQTTPPAEPVQTPAPAAAEPAPAAPVPLTTEQIRERRNAIFLMEGVFVNAVRLAAANTADRIQSIQPGIGMFTSAPARAHGSYLEGYGVFFHVEIPSVMPSVVSIVETLERERLRQNPAQQTSLAGGRAPMMDPDADYVASVQRQLVNAMLDHSKALDLGADEWLTVEAREAQETPGQISQPSTLILRVRGADLTEFMARRLTRDEIRKRVLVRGF